MHLRNLILLMISAAQCSNRDSSSNTSKGSRFLEKLNHAVSYGLDCMARPDQFWDPARTYGHSRDARVSPMERPTGSSNPLLSQPAPTDASNGTHPFRSE